MRYLSLLCILYFPHLIFSGYEASPSQSFVEQWCTKYINSKEPSGSIVPQDVQVLLNLFYLAYKRSSYVIELQEKALEALDILWTSWQQIIQLRLNPNHSSSHPTDTLTMEESIDQFSNQLHEFETVSKQFSEFVTHMASNKLLSDNALKALQEIQRQEQIMIAESIASIKPHIDELLNQLTPSEDPHQHTITKGSSIVDFIWACLPHLAINSFTETDHLLAEISKEQWNLVKTLQHITNMNWSVIEHGRSDFYLLLYKTTSETAQEEGIDIQHLKALFEHNKQLPLPKKIQSNRIPLFKDIQPLPNRLPCRPRRKALPFGSTFAESSPLKNGPGGSRGAPRE